MTEQTHHELPGCERARRAIEIARQARENARVARDEAVAAARAANNVNLKLDAHLKVLEALRETQLEQGRILAGLVGRVDGTEGRLDHLEGRFDRLEGRFDRLEGEMREGFSQVATGMAQIVALISNLERN